MVASPAEKSPTEQGLVELVLSHASAEAATWFEKFFPPLGEPLARGRFFGTFAGCGRRLKDARIPDDAAIAKLRALGISEPSFLSPTDWARAALLLRGLSLLEENERPGLYKEALQKGDVGEQVSALKALCLLPRSELYLESAIGAARTNVVEAFSALANDNPYPAAHFPDLEFNQLVMKALFMGVSARRIVDIEPRVTSELVRMARDYASERHAAGRSIPSDIEFIEHALLSSAD